MRVRRDSGMEEGSIVRWRWWLKYLRALENPPSPAVDKVNEVRHMTPTDSQSHGEEHSEGNSGPERFYRGSTGVKVTSDKGRE